MESGLQMVVHGRGNAWPVPLGDTHPFYDKNDPRDLSNAAFSLVASDRDRVLGDVLVDAGHGTIQSLVSGSNRIPDCICLTHGHMDHTLSVDWIVQSYWRHHEQQRLYPVYTTASVYQFLIQSYPHLEPLTEFRELKPGITRHMDPSNPLTVTSYPVYHGQSAVGASMLLFEMEECRVLFTGDLLSPLLRRKDYQKLKGVDLLVVDTNNRFPWPRTNHWSFAGHPLHPLERSDVLHSFLENLTWSDVTAPHEGFDSGEPSREYFQQLKCEWDLTWQPFTLLEFLRIIEPKQVVMVHYSGAEDLKYYNESVFTAKQLSSWAIRTAESVGINSQLIVPNTGQVIPI